MSVREYAIPELPGVASSLFSDCYVVAITPATGNTQWAAEAVWRIARAAAATGRSTALIDLNLENPSLHTLAKHPRDTGIVDAFLFGASLQHVASPDEDPNLHFIGVGTPPTEVEDVWASSRWQRLSRGFGQEEALLLLFLPPEALEALSLAPDLIIAVTPSGFGPRGPRSPHIRSAIDRGVPLAVVSEPPEPALGNQTPNSEEGIHRVRHSTVTAVRAPRLKRKGIWPVVGVAVAAVVTASFLLISRREASLSPFNPASDAGDPPVISRSDSTPQGAETVTASDEPASPAPEEAAGLPAAPTPSPPADTLGYSIQVAAWSQLSRALAHFTELTQAGVSTTISAVSRGSDGVWFRVIAGAVADRSAAETLLQRLRSDGTIDETGGFLVNTPFAFLLETHPDARSGEQALRGLRESGIPAYIVSMSDGSVQVLVGAFESHDQAEMADSAFPEAGRDLSRVLVTRVGIAR
jgi:cell division septation protein DedD